LTQLLAHLSLNWRAGGASAASAYFVVPEPIRMLNFKTPRICALGLAFAVSSALPVMICATSAGAATVLAKVNGKEITDEDLKLADQDLGSAVPRQLTGKARDSYLLDYLIDGQLVAQKAEADKLDQTADFPNQLAYYREKLLMEALLSKVAKDATTDAALKAAYDDAAKQAKPETEIHARHILVATKEEAEAALKRIKAGEDFAKVAKEVSKDPGSEGGDLGWFTKDRMIPEFADAAFKLDVGQVSDPVHTQFGWHIIKVEGKRQTSFPPFDQVKDQVERYVVQKAQADMITDLRKNAKIERMDDAADAAKPDATKPDATKTDPKADPNKK
jgi:peptidyl-prolyl cis-trans isomerase C